MGWCDVNEALHGSASLYNSCSDKCAGIDHRMTRHCLDELDMLHLSRDGFKKANDTDDFEGLV